MAYDPATRRLFIACVANGSLEVIDLDAGTRIGTIARLRGPQGVAVAGRFVYVATGGDGRLNRFDTRVPTSARSAAVGDDADNVRVAPDGKIWVSFGGEGPGGLASFDGDTLRPGPEAGLAANAGGISASPVRRCDFRQRAGGQTVGGRRHRGRVETFDR